MSSPEVDTRERILKETWRLMEQRRGQGIRIEDIAQAAGVSRQAVYLHYGNRTALLIATVRYVDEALGLAERIKPVMVEQDGIQSLEAFVVFWASYIPDIYGLAKALLNVRDTDPAAASAWTDRMQVLMQGCLTTVRCLDKDGVLAPAWTIETAADFFWSILSIEMWEKLTVERGWSTQQYVERIQTTLKRTLVKSS